MPSKEPEAAIDWTNRLMPTGFGVEIYPDPETGRPIPHGTFTRNWEEEEPLDRLLDQLETGRISDRQALTKARKLETAAPNNLEIQNFIANRLWALGLRDEAFDVHQQAFERARSLIPKRFKGLIIWSEIDNRPFLRLAHGTLLGLMHRRDCGAALPLARQMLAWCPGDNLGIRYLMGDIALLMGDYPAAMKEYLKYAACSPSHWYQAALIKFREQDFVVACTYLRRGVVTNPYIAEGLTGRTVLAEHLYWHGSSVNGPQWAIDYLESPACDWKDDELDFMDWVFNSSEMLKERAERMAINEGLTYENDLQKRGFYLSQSERFDKRITDALSKKMVRKVKNSWGDEIWPWEREGFMAPLAVRQRAGH